MEKKYFIRIYGCQMNLHEAEKLAGMLEADGYEKADSPEKADVIVFLSCCIRENAEQKLYGHIGALKPYKTSNPSVVIAVGGCMTQQDGAAKKLRDAFPFVDIVFGTHNLCDFTDLLKKHGKKAIVEIPESGEEKECVPMRRSSYPNAWVNVIYGCNNFCTYCIVPYVKGREQSRKISDVVCEVENLVRDGYKEITLLGQNVNSYGNDLKDGSDFSTLLDEVCKIDGKFRLRFMSSHPKDLTEKLVQTIASHKNICHSIHLPLQSGSDSVLKAMNRKYTRAQYLEKVGLIKKYMPDCAISTDVMVGFPNETDQDFYDTMEIMDKVGFSSAFMFVYSPRSGTPAAKMDGQIDAEISKRRIVEMVACQNERTAAVSKTYEGKSVEILCEDYNAEKNLYLGRDEYGRMGYFKSDENLIGKFVTVKVGKTSGISLYGDVTKVE